MHLVASTTTWYAARAGGVVAYLLVSACVLAGILLAGKRRVPGLPRFAVEDVHRFLGILAGVFIAVHVAAIALDTVVPFSLTQLVVPFTSSYRPLATGLGVVALELLLAVSLTNRLRSRLPYRIWRRAHYATLGVWLLATIHGILSGTDRGETWLLALYAVTVATIAGAMALRLPRPPETWSRARLRSARRGGRAVECGGLENRYPS
jgi:sulfoxide reductase heme-binding subunit YedZ